MSRHPKTDLIFSILFICCLSMSGFAYAQDRQSSEPRVFGEPDGMSGVECDSIKMYLDFVHIAAMEAGEDRAIIIIARLGSGERSHSLNRRRLNAPSSYLVNNRGFPKARVVAAEGERVRSLGQVEFYVGGRLHTVFKVKRNRDLVKGCSSDV